MKIRDYKTGKYVSIREIKRLIIQGDDCGYSLVWNSWDENTGKGTIIKTKIDPRKI